MVDIRIGAETGRVSWDEWEERVRSGRVPPDAEVRFGPVTGEHWVKAVELDMYQSLRAEDALTWRGNFQKGRPPILTAVLLGIQVRIWWFAQLPEVRRPLVTHFTNWTAPTLENGEIWRPFTMGILHYEWQHIAANMLFFAYTGWNLERALGRMNLAILFGASILGGSLLSMFFSPEKMSLGASGGIFGLMGASVVFGLAHPKLVPERGRQLFGAAILPYLLLMLWSGLRDEQIDNFSHIGGLFTGALLVLLLDPTLLQRKPRWNARIHASVAMGSAAVLAGLAILGPRITPLLPHEEARALLLPPQSILVADKPYQPLSWRAPAGWGQGVSAAGDLGFTSPAGPRVWSVSLRDHERAESVASTAESWGAALRRGFADAQFSEPVETVVAGRRGLQQRARIHSDGQVLELTWRGASVGVWTLQMVWQVESDAHAHLAPLEARLVASILWSDPQALVAARTQFSRQPESIRARARLAAALARVGETEEATRIQRRLAEEDSDNSDHWSALFETAWLSEHVPEELPSWWDQALKTPSPRVLMEVAESLNDHGRMAEARGLLDQSWWLTPGDRSLARARRRQGLPVYIDPQSGLPWLLAIDGGTLEPRNTAAQDALLGLPVDRANAASVDEQRTQERLLLTAQTALWLKQSDPRVTLGLTVLKYGFPRDSGLDSLENDLKMTVDGQAPEWLPAPLQESIRSHYANLPAPLNSTETP